MGVIPDMLRGPKGCEDTESLELAYDKQGKRIAYTKKQTKAGDEHKSAQSVLF